MSSTRPTKRSFTKLPVDIDVPRLLGEYQRIPKEAWATSHWAVHCSCNMLLLRGGTRGTEGDFTTPEPQDSPWLAELPYMKSLVDEGGPFGGCTYAFIFRMKPMGVARPHVDDNTAWHDPFRVHIPITTNPGARLLCQGRGQHLAVGEAWTFDNQALHGVVNGDTVRAHLILDVPLNPKLERLLTHASWVPGVKDPEGWRRASLPEALPSLAPATAEPLAAPKKEALGLHPDGFAARVSTLRPIARLTRAPLKKGDVIYSVNGVEECAVARTAIDYLLLRHRPGEVVELGVLRRGARLDIPLRLYPNPIPSRVRRTLWRAAAKMQGS